MLVLFQKSTRANYAPLSISDFIETSVNLNLSTNGFNQKLLLLTNSMWSSSAKFMPVAP